MLPNKLVINQIYQTGCAQHISEFFQKFTEVILFDYILLILVLITFLKLTACKLGPSKVSNLSAQAHLINDLINYNNSLVISFLKA